MRSPVLRLKRALNRVLTALQEYALLALLLVLLAEATDEEAAALLDKALEEATP